MICTKCNGSGKLVFKEIDLQCNQNKCSLCEIAIGSLECQVCNGSGNLPSDVPFVIPL